MSDTTHPVDSILRTKIRLPRPGVRVLNRGHLYSHLQDGLERRLILLCAPPGSGKTTLLAGWLAQCDLPAAWLTLDQGDNSLESFLAYLLASIQAVAPEIGRAAQEMLVAPSPLQKEAFLSSLINDLDEYGEGLILVLDDYHNLQLPLIQDTVDYLVDHLPENLHLVIASRADPALPLGRLRARNQLVELRGADLRFSFQEAADFLNKMMGHALAAEDIQELEEKTEGWVAGLQLAALALHERADPHQFIHSFTGSHRFVLDYLVEEVLRQQPDDVQEFLLQTSILERMCENVCNVLTGRQDAGLVLERLEKNNVFVLSLDDEGLWYRYHTLFGDLLRYQLERARPEAVPSLHRRAAAWFETNSYPMDAVHHWLAAREPGQAARLVKLEGSRLLENGMVNQVLGWLNTLPVSLFNTDPELHLLSALVLISMGLFNQVEPHLQAVESRIAELQEPQRIQAEIEAVRAVIAFSSGEYARAIETGERALAGMSKTSALYSSVLLGMGVSYHLNNKLNLACKFFDQAAQYAVQMHLHTVAISALSNLGDIYVEQGRLHQAEQAYQRGLELSEGVLSSGPYSGLPLAGLSGLYYEWNDLEKALSSVLEALQRIEKMGNPALLAAAYARRAACELASGKPEEADRSMASANELVPKFASVALFARTLRAMSIQFWLRSGQLKQAYRAVQEEMPVSDISQVNQEEKLVEISTRVAVGHAQNNAQMLTLALEEIEAILPPLRQCGRENLVLQVLLQKILALTALGEESRAIALLAQVLALAEPEGYTRLFLDQGATVARLLRKLPDTSPQAGYVRQLLAAFHDEAVGIPAHPSSAGPALQAAEDLVEPLTAREQEVLRLVTEGFSNQEIAARLTLSPGTVKRHLHNIYGKLEVSTRPQAISCARKLNLV